MPYIKPEDRVGLDPHIEALTDAINKIVWGKPAVEIAGVLNYCITRVILRSLKNSFGSVRYWMSPLVRGVLQDVGDEFYRRKMHKYENQKIDENSDIPEYME